MSGRKRTTYSTNMSDRDLKKIFIKGRTVQGLDPDIYRVDAYGSLIVFDNYGTYKVGGWHVDHIVPKSRDGSDDICNLQPLNSYTNSSKGNTLKKKRLTRKSGGTSARLSTTIIKTLINSVMLG